tara:strand:- start:473 stop:1174 length:702 start_codon:yes stop_codon:yes gene_type:complete
MNNKIITIICARKNSKGLKNKNILLLNGKPLIYYTIKSAIKSNYTKDIYVSTDSSEIAINSEKFGAKALFPRPKYLSGDNITSEKVLQYTLKKIEKIKKIKYDYVLYLQVTEPFRNKNIIDRCIYKILKNKKIDSVFAAKPYKKNIWYKKNNKIIRLNYFERYGIPRQKKNLLYREDTGIACISKASFIRKGLRLGNNVEIVKHHNDFDYIDIHNKNDLYLSNIILKKKIFKL